MTVNLVMGNERSKRPVRPGARQRGPGTSGRPEPDPGGPDKDEASANWTEPSMITPENDVALARMMGCAFLFGLACIAGLLMLAF